MSENNENKEPLNKNNKVPKLRFKEFNNDWNLNNLKSISTPIKEKNSNNIGLVLSNSAIHGLISQSNFFDKDIANTDNTDKYYVIKKGDFVYNPRKSNYAPYGPINILENYNEGIVSPLYTCFNVDSKYKLFLKWYFKSTKWYRYIYINGDQGARGDRVSIKDITFFKMPIYLPDNFESQKIVSLFELIQQKITNLDKKISTLKKYKEGLQKALFKSSTINSNFSLKNKVKFEPKSKIQAGDNIENGLYTLYKSGTENGKINTYSHDGVYIIANDGGTAQFKLTNGRFSYTDHCICFKTEADDETIFLCNYLQSLEKKINYVGFVGTGLKNIDRQYLGMIKYPNIENKKTIAKSFVLIDKAIVKLERKYSLLTLIKKFMLNNLFI